MFRIKLNETHLKGWMLYSLNKDAKTEMQDWNKHRENAQYGKQQASIELWSRVEHLAFL